MGTMEPIRPIGRETLFPLMTDDALAAWVSMVREQARLLPAAVRELARRRTLSYAEICEATGVPTSTISRWATPSALAGSSPTAPGSGTTSSSRSTTRG